MKKRKNKQLAVLVALSQVQFIAAQTPGFDDDVQDVPVDNWVIPMIFLGITVGYVYFRKKKAIQ